MRFLLTISLALWLGAAQAESVRMLVQSSPLAGSQYYAVGEQWREMAVGDHLDLIREPDNRHDHAPSALSGAATNWATCRAPKTARGGGNGSGRQAGRAHRKIDRTPNPWRRVEFEVYVDL
jgi:hypothetical protein